MYAIGADLIVVAHLLYVCFAVGGTAVIPIGALFGWRWIRNLTYRLIHLAAVTLVAVEALLGVVCPLTDWEYVLRLRAGQRVDEQLSFVARITRRIIFYDFPLWVFTVTYMGLAVLVLLTLILVPPRWKCGGKSE